MKQTKQISDNTNNRLTSEEACRQQLVGNLIKYEGIQVDPTKQNTFIKLAQITTKMRMVST